MKTINFAIIGIGLMGREFASAVMRWPHLEGMEVKPNIVSICGSPVTDRERAWYTAALPSITHVTDDYREVLSNPDVEAVYCAVPHFLHEQIYCDIIKAGKHLLGEKPFGIDRAANDTIMRTIAEHPQVFVRCSSEFPFAPAMQRMGRMIEQKEFGTIIEVEAGFLHSSDLDLKKPINWKRIVKLNGEYGCMGDLGMHVCHVPFRAGWIPERVSAILSNIVPRRPDGKGGMVDCDTWDNATLLCDTVDGAGNRFPMTLKTQRIAPGEKNTWYIRIKGTDASAEFSTKQMNTLAYMYSADQDQNLRVVDMGHETAFKSITGGIFEFGFSDAILQMWAAFLHELTHSGTPLHPFAGCVTPEEAARSHALFTAALVSHRDRSTEVITY